MGLMSHGAGLLRPDASAGDRLTGRARRLALGSPARLRRAAARQAGGDGLTLACAVIDMIAAGESPAGWLIAEMIELLDTSAGRRDRQVNRLARRAPDDRGRSPRYVGRDAASLEYAA